MEYSIKPKRLGERRIIHYPQKRIIGLYVQIDLKSNVGLQVMPIDELIERVASVCKRCGAEHLDLFGSFATGTATARSDIDFVVYGDVDSELLNQMISQIDTLRKIDIFYYNEINDEYLLKDILVKQLGITDFAIGSLREVLQSAFTNGLISDDIWLKMLKTRNLLARDYDGKIAEKNFQEIISNYYDAFDGLKDAITKFYDGSLPSIDSFD